MNTRISGYWLSATGDSFGATNGFQIQFPLIKRHSAALARQISVQLSLGFGKSILSILSRTASSLIRIVHFFHKLLDLSAQGRMRLAPTILSERCLISRFDLIAPVGFRRPVQSVQRCIGGVCHFSHCTFAKQPGEDRPIHRFGHQRLGFFDFGKLSHSEKNIISREQKVQWAGASGEENVRS